MTITQNIKSSMVLWVRLSVMPLSQVFTSPPWVVGFAVCDMLADWKVRTDTDLYGVIGPYVMKQLSVISVIANPEWSVL